MTTGFPPPTSSRPSRRAVVIGGGLTGMLVAQALSTVADVVVLERDTLPDQPEPRRGLPQGHHSHLLWSGGAKAVESLLAGTAVALEKAGVHRIPLTTGMVGYSPKGWFRRWPESHYVITCSRDLLDSVIRRQVLKNEHILLKQNSTVTGLRGTASVVTGVDARTASGEDETLSADLVVDSSGKGSRTPTGWTSSAYRGPLSVKWTQALCTRAAPTRLQLASPPPGPSSTAPHTASEQPPTSSIASPTLPRAPAASHAPSRTW